MTTDAGAPHPDPPHPPGVVRRLRNYLIAGLLIWIPILVTLWVLLVLADLFDQSLVLLPHAWRPQELFGFDIRGWGVVPSVLLLIGTGVVAHNLFGRQMVEAIERQIRRVPVLGSIYGGAKIFSETVLTDRSRSFRQVVLVEFPRKGAYSIGFITADEVEEANARTQQDLACVFVPHTPNAATGFIVLIAREEVVSLDMTVDEAFKMMVTLGVVVPKWGKRPADARLAPPPSGP